MKLNNLILISGSGRNVGKTTLACNIINKLSEKHIVVGLKISPHFHKTTENQQLISEGKSFKVYQELDKNQHKDSSRMLNAGAEKVFFIQSEDENIKSALVSINNKLPTTSPIVCESGSLANKIEVGMHLLVSGPNPDISKTSYKQNLKKADFVVTQLDYTTSSIFFNLDYDNKNWKIENL